MLLINANGLIIFSGRIPCPHPGRIWLEQRGLQRALYWQIEARVVLDLQEFPISVGILVLCFLFFKKLVLSGYCGQGRLKHASIHLCVYFHSIFIGCSLLDVS